MRNRYQRGWTVTAVLALSAFLSACGSSSSTSNSGQNSAQASTSLNKLDQSKFDNAKLH